MVAILNKELPSGVVLNALAHITIGLGAKLNKEQLLLDNYQDFDGNIYPNISKMPFIILRATSNEIRKLVLTARELNLDYGCFINTMTDGGWQEQIHTTTQTPEENLIYYGCVLYGSVEKINPLTKKFSLWKN